METGTTGQKVNERQIVAGLKVIETEVRVQRPVWEDIIVERVTFKDRQVDVPVGIDKVLNDLADKLVEKVLEKVEAKLSARLDKAIDARIKQIEVPTITYKEEVKVITKDVHVTNAIITDVPVNNAVLVNKEVINPILVDKPVINPIFHDVEMERPIYQDRVVINPVFTDVAISKPKFIDKEIVVIHPKYIDMKGNPEPAA